MAQHFSDKPGSLQSSIGVFVTGRTYHGKHGIVVNFAWIREGH